MSVDPPSSPGSGAHLCPPGNSGEDKGEWGEFPCAQDGDHPLRCGFFIDPSKANNSDEPRPIDCPLGGGMLVWVIPPQPRLVGIETNPGPSDGMGSPNEAAATKPRVRIRKKAIPSNPGVGNQAPKAQRRGRRVKVTPGKKKPKKTHSGKGLPVKSCTRCDFSAPGITDLCYRCKSNKEGKAKALGATRKRGTRVGQSAALINRSIQDSIAKDKGSADARRESAIDPVSNPWKPKNPKPLPPLPTGPSSSPGLKPLPTPPRVWPKLVLAPPCSGKSFYCRTNKRQDLAFVDGDELAKTVLAEHAQSMQKTPADRAKAFQAAANYLAERGFNDPTPGRVILFQQEIPGVAISGVVLIDETQHRSFHAKRGKKDCLSWQLIAQERQRMDQMGISKYSDFDHILFDCAGPSRHPSGVDAPQEVEGSTEEDIASLGVEGDQGEVAPPASSHRPHTCGKCGTTIDVDHDARRFYIVSLPCVECTDSLVLWINSKQTFTYTTGVSFLPKWLWQRSMTKTARSGGLRESVKCPVVVTKAVSGFACFSSSTHLVEYRGHMRDAKVSYLDDYECGTTLSELLYLMAAANPTSEGLVSQETKNPGITPDVASFLRRVELDRQLLNHCNQVVDPQFLGSIARSVLHQSSQSDARKILRDVTREVALPNWFSRAIRYHSKQLLE